MASTRREFLTNAGRVVVVLPVGWAMLSSIACGEGNECNDAGAVAATATGVTVTSACTSNHVHTFTLNTAELESPPAEGKTGPTSSYEGHTHTIALSQAQLESIQSGVTVEVTSTASDGHTHLFQFHAPA